MMGKSSPETLFSSTNCMAFSFVTFTIIYLFGKIGKLVSVCICVYVYMCICVYCVYCVYCVCM